jgi:hypothetical protein
MKWSPYKHGHLAKCEHGYYFVYKKFNHKVGQERWFTEYEAGADKFGENGHLTGKIQGFDGLSLV